MGPEIGAGWCPHAVGAASALSPEIAIARTGATMDELVSHLYVCQGLSTYRIGELTGMGRQRVGRRLARLGIPVKPRGAGRRRADEHQAVLDQLMERMYVESGFSSRQIAAATGVPQRTVRDRLHARGVRMRTKGRFNRADRAAVPADALAKLYVVAGLSAADAGRFLGVSRNIVLRAAHDEGLPVRVGGPEPSRGPTEIELVEALEAELGEHSSGFRIDDEDLEELRTVRDAVDYVVAKLGAS